MILWYWNRRPRRKRMLQTESKNNIRTSKKSEDVKNQKYKNFIREKKKLEQFVYLDVLWVKDVIGTHKTIPKVIPLQKYKFTNSLHVITRSLNP